MRSGIRLALVAAAGLVLLLASATPALAKAADRNHNKIPDKWERKYHLSTKKSTAKKDTDHDGLNNRNEYLAGTSPRKKDSNRNGVRDGLEDRDDDGLVNLAEVLAKTSIRNEDTDGDGDLDSEEDPDGDGLNNAQEFACGTHPLRADSDWDGVGDGAEDADGDGSCNSREYEYGTDPRNRDSDYDGTLDGAELSGVVTSWDPDTGVMILTASDAAHTRYTVVVSFETALEWVGQEFEDEDPMMEDITEGMTVSRLEATTQGDGSLLAIEMTLMDSWDEPEAGE